MRSIRLAPDRDFQLAFSAVYLCAFEYRAAVFNLLDYFVRNSGRDYCAIVTH